MTIITQTRSQIVYCRADLIEEMKGSPLFNEEERSGISAAQSYMKTAPNKAYIILISVVIHPAIARAGDRAPEPLFGWEEKLLSNLGPTAQKQIALFKRSLCAVSSIEKEANRIARLYDESIAKMYEDAKLSVKTERYSDLYEEAEKILTLQKAEIERARDLARATEALSLEAETVIDKAFVCLTKAASVVE